MSTLHVSEAGNPGYQLEFQKRVFDPQFGNSWLYRYKGKHDPIVALGETYIARGWRTEMTQNGEENTILELYISDPSEINEPGNVDEVVEQWTWESEFFTRDIYANPLVHSTPTTTAPLQGSVTFDQMKLIEKALKHWSAGETTEFDAAYNNLNPKGTSPSNPNQLALDVLAQKAKGQQYDEVDLPALTRTRTYPIAYTSRRVVEMVESFYSTARLIAIEQIPIIIQNTMPATPPLKSPNTEWGWKERFNNQQILPQLGKVTETTRWTFNAWSSLTYNYLA